MQYINIKFHFWFHFQTSCINAWFKALCAVPLLSYQVISLLCFALSTQFEGHKKAITASCITRRTLFIPSNKWVVFAQFKSTTGNLWIQEATETLINWRRSPTGTLIGTRFKFETKRVPRSALYRYMSQTKLPLYKVDTVLVTIRPTHTVALLWHRMKNVYVCSWERESVYVSVGGEPVQCC